VSVCVWWLYVLCMWCTTPCWSVGPILHRLLPLLLLLLLESVGRWLAGAPAQRSKIKRNNTTDDRRKCSVCAAAAAADGDAMGKDRGRKERGDRERHARGRFAERRMQSMTDEGRPRRPAKRSIKAARLCLCLVLVLFLLMDCVILSLRCCNRFITWKGAAAAAAEILIEQHTHTQSVGWIAEERV